MPQNVSLSEVRVCHQLCYRGTHILCDLLLPFHDHILPWYNQYNCAEPEEAGRPEKGEGGRERSGGGGRVGVGEILRLGFGSLGPGRMRDRITIYLMKGGNA